MFNRYAVIYTEYVEGWTAIWKVYRGGKRHPRAYHIDEMSEPSAARFLCLLQSMVPQFSRDGFLCFVHGVDLSAETESDDNDGSAVDEAFPF